MFFEGDLRSGITASIQQGKPVACLVIDDGEESKIWQEDFLKEPEITTLLTEKAITLKLTAGSQEAGYLAEIYPIPKTPTLVMILQGTLKAYLTSGTSKEDFMSGVKQAFTASPTQTTLPPQSTSSSSTSTSQTPPSQTPAVASMMEERRQRMDAQKKAHDDKIKAEKAAARAKLEADAPPDPKREASQKYAAEQRKRQQAAKSDRERVLKQIADDKLARKEKEDLRKEQSRATGMIEEAISSPSSSLKPSAPKQGGTSALQIRLFDGSTIRSRFPSNQTLRDHVRKWIDEQRGDDDTPYTFRQILSPLPNKAIGDAEEEESLQDIGLCPSATLVLVKVQDSAGAYGTSGGISSAYGLVSSGFGMVTGALGGLLGGRAAAPAASEPLLSSTQRTKTKDEDRQFYNGNSLAFEPRKDDDKKQD